ncbi:MAG: PAS domain S-box protein, partial [Deltaproteobacteria bacterium]
MEDERKTKKQLIEELNCLRLEQIEQAKINSEKFTKAFLQNSIPTVITAIKDGRVVEVSDAFLRLVGRKRHEVIGYTAVEGGFLTEKQRAAFYSELNKNGLVENLEMEISIGDGLLRYGLFNVVMMSINNENCLLTTIQDISKRKQAEEEKAIIEVQNRQLQKSESLGRMAGAIAHHFNNKLGAVIGNLELAL